jgi:hypothetical protein
MSSASWSKFSGSNARNESKREIGGKGKMRGSVPGADRERGSHFLFWLLVL